MENKKDIKLERIIKAFTQEPFDKPKNLFRTGISIPSMIIFDGLEVEEAFKGLDWKEKIREPYSILRTFEERINFPRDFMSTFSEEAFLYYLPFFLSAILIDHREADVMIYPVSYHIKEGKLYKRLSGPQKEIYNIVMHPFR